MWRWEQHGDVYKRQSRNVTNTRMRDFYDIYILQKLYGEQLQKQVLWTALVAHRFSGAPASIL